MDTEIRGFQHYSRLFVSYWCKGQNNWLKAKTQKYSHVFMRAHTHTHTDKHFEHPTITT